MERGEATLSENGRCWSQQAAGNDQGLAGQQRDEGSGCGHIASFHMRRGAARRLLAGSNEVPSIYEPHRFYWAECKSRAHASCFVRDLLLPMLGADAIKEKIGCHAAGAAQLLRTAALREQRVRSCMCSVF